MADWRMPAWIIGSITRAGSKKRKSERGVVPNCAVERSVPRQQRSVIEAALERRRGVIPVENGALGVPYLRRAFADREGAYDRLRGRRIGRGSDGLEIKPAAASSEIKESKVGGCKHRG